MIPQTDHSISKDDGEMLMRWCKNLGVRTVLEFGPGYSTNFFLQAGCNVTSCESNIHWFQEFAKHPESRLVNMARFFESDFPLEIPEIKSRYFDLAFIDAPKGDVFPASRINTALYAWYRCGLIAMHDTNRPGERLTVRILQALGCQIIAEYSESIGGLTLLKVKA